MPSVTRDMDDLATTVLKQIAWFRHELAMAERMLSEQELLSVRSAILKSIAELKSLYTHIDKCATRL